jgi:hypothetical protein
MKTRMMAEDYITHILLCHYKNKIWNSQRDEYVFTVFREVQAFRKNLPRSSAKQKTLSS